MPERVYRRPGPAGRDARKCFRHAQQPSGSGNTRNPVSPTFLFHRRLPWFVLLMFARGLRTMPSRTLAASQRARAISQHMSASTQATTATPSPASSSTDEVCSVVYLTAKWSLYLVLCAIQPSVLFESVGQVKKYILNRPSKLNSLDTTMLNLLRPYVEVCVDLIVLLCQRV